MPNSDYWHEKGVTNAIAVEFADKKKNPTGVTSSVDLTLRELNERLQIRPETIAAISLHFKKAVTECAK